MISYMRRYFTSDGNRFRFTLDNNIKFKIFNSNNPISSLNNENFCECNNDIIELKYPIYEELEVRKFCKKFPFR